MERIVEYTLIAGSDIAAFNNDINEKLKLGWRPFGGLSSVLLRDDRLGNTHIQYAQTLLRYEQTNEPG